MRPHRAIAGAAVLASLGLGQPPADHPNAPASPSAGPQHLPPADAEGAAKALTDSPRHGEWIDIPLAEMDLKIKTWVVYPERADSAPVILVIHEIFGLTDWIRAVADQLAAEGFIAVAPDLLSGRGPGGDGTESFTGDAVRSEIRKLTDDEVATRLDAVRAHALTFPAASGRSGSIGFCWGGTASFMYATRQRGLDAAVVYYGTAPPAEQLATVRCPVLGLYGGDDNRVTSTVAATAETMNKLDLSFTHHVYAGAGHGFLRQQSGREGANDRAARAAWEESIEFLRARLQ